MKMLNELLAFKSRTRGAKDKQPRKRRDGGAHRAKWEREIADMGQAIRAARAGLRQRGDVETEPILARESSAHRSKRKFAAFNAARRIERGE